MPVYSFQISDPVYIQEGPEKLCALRLHMAESRDISIIEEHGCIVQVEEGSISSAVHFAERTCSSSAAESEPSCSSDKLAGNARSHLKLVTLSFVGFLVWL